MLMLQAHFFHRPPPVVTKGSAGPHRRSAVAVAGDPHPMQTGATPGSDAWLSPLEQAASGDGQKAVGLDAGLGGGYLGTGQLKEEEDEGWGDVEERGEEIGIGCHTLGVQGRWRAQEWQGPEEEEDFEGHGWVDDGWGQDYADDNEAERESEHEADLDRAWEQAGQERLYRPSPSPRAQHQQQHQQRLLTRLLDDQAAVLAGLPPQLPTPLAQEGARQLLQEGPRQLQQVSPADKNKAHEEYVARRQEMLRRKEEWLKVGGRRG